MLKASDSFGAFFILEETVGHEKAPVPNCLCTGISFCRSTALSFVHASGL